MLLPSYSALPARLCLDFLKVHFMCYVLKHLGDSQLRRSLLATSLLIRIAGLVTLLKSVVLSTVPYPTLPC